MGCIQILTPTPATGSRFPPPDSPSVSSASTPLTTAAVRGPFASGAGRLPTETAASEGYWGPLDWGTGVPSSSPFGRSLADDHLRPSKPRGGRVGCGGKERTHLTLPLEEWQEVGSSGGADGLRKDPCAPP